MEKHSQLVEAFKGKDDLGVVIRSHIIVEQYLNEIIESPMLFPEKYQNEINLDYHVKVKLAIAIGLHKRFEPSLNVLGTLRNDFAHNIREEITKQDANNFYKSFDEERKKTVQKLLVNIKSRHKEYNLPDYRNLVPKDKFLLYVLTLCGALELAREFLLDNKKV